MPDQPDHKERTDNGPTEGTGTQPPEKPEALAAALVPPADADALLLSEQRARLAEDRLAEVLAAYRQLKTDTETYRERASRTIERRFETRHEKLLVKFIDILDNFDRALEAAETTYAGGPLIEGLILVRTQLLQTLQQEGLERIPVLGLPFDPHVSEAMGTEKTDDADQAGVVIKEYQRGYRFNNKLVRASRVVVAEYAPAPQASVASAPPPGTPAAIPVDDHPEPLRPTAPEETGPTTEAEDEGPSLEEIVARAEAQQALFHEAFSDDARAARPHDDEAEP